MLLPETVAELFRTQENIVGLKEATGNLAQASKTMYLTDGKLDLYFLPQYSTAATICQRPMQTFYIFFLIFPQ